MNGQEFIETFMPLRDNLYKVAYYILESREDARDAVQDLYVKLWNSKDALDAVANPKAYCITLLRNDCIDRIRKAQKSGEVDMPQEMPGGNGEEYIVGREALGRALKAMEKLSPAQREVLRMSALEGLSYEEMSQRTGMNNLTLRVLLSQARKRIRNSI